MSGKGCPAKEARSCPLPTTKADNNNGCESCADKAAKAMAACNCEKDAAPTPNCGAPSACPPKEEASACPPKEDPCAPKVDACPPKEDPCAPKEDACPPKEDPCAPKVDACPPKEEACGCDKCATENAGPKMIKMLDYSSCSDDAANANSEDSSSGGWGGFCGAPGEFNDNNCEPRPLFFDSADEKGGCGPKCSGGM